MSGDKDIERVDVVVEKWFVVAVREVVRLFVLVCWLFGGIFFWLPLLTRNIISFMWNVVVSSFSGSDMGKAQDKLDMAIKFYAVGFRKINNAVSKTPVSEEPDDRSSSNFFWGVLPDLTFSIVFWLVIGSLYGVIFIDIHEMSDTIADIIDLVKERIDREAQNP